VRIPIPGELPVTGPPVPSGWPHPGNPVAYANRDPPPACCDTSFPQFPTIRRKHAPYTSAQINSASQACVTTCVTTPISHPPPPPRPHQSNPRRSPPMQPCKPDATAPSGGGSTPEMALFRHFSVHSAHLRMPPSFGPKPSPARLYTGHRLCHRKSPLP
jgi:hypothetical protein